MLLALCLIALTLGYRTFVLANRETKDARTVGRIIGIYVIMFALAGSVCALMKIAKDECRTLSKADCPPAKFCPLKIK